MKNSGLLYKQLSLTINNFNYSLSLIVGYLIICFLPNMIFDIGHGFFVVLNIIVLILWLLYCICV